MKNNNGLGLYEIGDRETLSCGCVIVAEEQGYTHYINPNCNLDNHFHPYIYGYAYKTMAELKEEIMTVQFKEEQRNQPRYLAWYETKSDYIDTYFKRDGKWLFLSGIAECAPDYEKKKIDNLKEQLVRNNCEFIRFYCHAPINNPNPLDMIEWVKTNNLTWEPFAKFYYLKDMHQWEFRGNCREYSAVFTFRIYDRGLAIKTKRAFQLTQDKQEEIIN